MVHDFLIDPWNAHDLLLRSFRQIVRIAANANGAEAGKATCRVLVADDDATIRMMVTGILGGSEIHCEVACDGYEALELARTFSPHVAILDINMPRMDGFEVLSAIKGDAFTRDVRVVMLSARQRETDVVRGFALGADDYVTKPFSPMELVARVRRALRAPRCEMAYRRSDSFKSQCVTRGLSMRDDGDAIPAAVGSVRMGESEERQFDAERDQRAACDTHQGLPGDEAGGEQHAGTAIGIRAPGIGQRRRIAPMKIVTLSPNGR